MNEKKPGDLYRRLRPFTGVAALVILCAVFGAVNPRFLTERNFFNVLDAVAIVGILAVGQAFTLIGGGFDLSQGAARLRRIATSARRAEADDDEGSHT